MMTIYFLTLMMMENKRNVMLDNMYELMISFIFINNQMVVVFFGEWVIKD